MGICGCVAAFGPGYTIERQTISVRFEDSAGPAIHIDSTYILKNTGNQPIDELEVRLPGRARFHFVNAHASWDKAELTVATSPDNPRNTLLKLAQEWKVGERRTLEFSAEYLPAATEKNLSFTQNAFFLPAQGWNPELLPSRGLFATGGVPPKNWELVAEVPPSFVVHMSGKVDKRQRKGGGGNKQILRAVQDAKSGYPFLIAGRYQQADLPLETERVHVWTLSTQDRGQLQSSGEALARAMRAYDSMFGNRLGKSPELWVTECPVAAGCFSARASAYERLVAETEEKTTAEMASSDTVMVDLSGGAPRIAEAAPSLAASWLGYGRNPGFYDQDPPLSALPAFAAARGREAAAGGRSREETIRRLLRAIPEREKGPARQAESGDVLRAKSFLFFFGLQDRFGAKALDAALQHTLDARSERGFNLDDLIAALEQESQQNVAEFVRLWMKHPGVPGDFRGRYRDAAAAAISKETSP